MRKMLIVGILIIASLHILSPLVFADSIGAGTTIQLKWDHGAIEGTDSFGNNLWGGEFAVYTKTGNNSYQYQFMTFCVEYSEHISLNTDYTVQGVSEKAINGNVGPGGDPLDARTAFLYYHFTIGDLAALSGGAFNPLNAQSIGDLQKAIWFIEEEGNHGADNYLVDLADNAIAGGTWSGIGNVRIMNMGGAIQDQLCMVPEPGLLLLLGSGLLGIAVVRRKVK